MTVKEIKEKNTWESFLLGCQAKTFISSWYWFEFQKMMNNKCWTLGVFDNDRLVATALVLKNIAKRGIFLIVPHGPNVKQEDYHLRPQILESLLLELKRIGKNENATLIRISPIWERSRENDMIFDRLGFVRAAIHSHPEASWKLDITPKENDLLMSMRKTGRYLIRQASKDKDIEVIQSQNIEDVKILDDLQQELIKSQRFIPFSLEYLEKELKSFSVDGRASLFLGKYQGKIIAASFVIYWSNIGFYHHAALLPEYHKVPISYLLQWQAIKEAKKRGCKLYDFWGYVNPEEKPNHPWAGPTFFKMSFGGKSFEYVTTRDYPLSWKYWLIYWFERLRRIKRGL